VVTAKSDTDQATSPPSARAETADDASSQVVTRPVSGHPASALSGGRGIGDVNQLSKPTSQASRRRSELDRLVAADHSAAVIDVSGSMGDRSATKTRMQLTIEAATGGLSLFPTVRSLGLWTSLDQDRVDGRLQGAGCRSRRMSKRQRGKIVDQLKIQHPITNGGHPLYNTAIAAVRAVRQQSTSVRSLDLLFHRRQERRARAARPWRQAVPHCGVFRTPGAPVRIIALGMGPDANADELSALAGATGGLAYVARNPGDLRTSSSTPSKALTHRLP